METASMADKDVKLMGELRQFAASHLKNGEPRTADLLERAARRIAELCWRKTTHEETAEITRAVLSADSANGDKK
jgi:hypothetical protein